MLTKWFCFYLYKVSNFHSTYLLSTAVDRVFMYLQVPSKSPQKQRVWFSSLHSRAGQIQQAYWPHPDVLIRNSAGPVHWPAVQEPSRSHWCHCTKPSSHRAQSSETPFPPNTNPECENVVTWIRSWVGWGLAVIKLEIILTEDDKVWHEWRLIFHQFISFWLIFGLVLGNLLHHW